MKSEIQNCVIAELKNIGFEKIIFDSEGYQSGKLNKIHNAQ